MMCGPRVCMLFTRIVNTKPLTYSNTATRCVFVCVYVGLRCEFMYGMTCNGRARDFHVDVDDDDATVTPHVARALHERCLTH